MTDALDTPASVAAQPLGRLTLDADSEALRELARRADDPFKGAAFGPVGQWCGSPIASFTEDGRKVRQGAEFCSSNHRLRWHRADDAEKAERTALLARVSASDRRPGPPTGVAVRSEARRLVRSGSRAHRHTDRQNLLAAFATDAA